MRRQAVSCISSLVVAVAAVAGDCGWPAQASGPLTRPETPADGASIIRAAGSGTDIVRMPPGPPGPPPSSGQPPTITPASPQAPLPTAPQPVAPAPPPPTPIRPAQPLGRVLKLPVKVGSLSSDGQKGWLGVRMEGLELALALSLGLLNANGAMILEATAGGPAGVAGVRFGDIVVAFNGRSIESMNDLRERVASTTPGDQAVLEVWRVAADDGDFLHTLRRLGDGGNAYVMYRLGRMYAAGISVARDEAEAVRWYRMGATAGNLHAMTALAVALLDGRGTGKDPQEAVRLLKAAANKDNLEAMYRLGVLFIQGKVVDKNTDEAARLFTKAGEAGHAPSMVDLGLMYNNGHGVQTDLARAAMWYKRAADLGNSSGMVNLGFLHQQGKGVAQDDIAAVSLYRRAANDGNPAGIHNLAAMYDSGKGLERKDPEQAAALMLRALELRNQFSTLQMTQYSNNWSRDFRRALQRKLRDAGFYAGKIDGNISQSTIAAINAYVERNR
jgi:TPR repeat protein